MLARVIKESSPDHTSTETSRRGWHWRARAQGQSTDGSITCGSGCLSCNSVATRLEGCFLTIQATISDVYCMAVSVLTCVRPLSVKTGLRLGLGLVFHQCTDKCRIVTDKGCSQIMA